MDENKIVEETKNVAKAEEPKKRTNATRTTVRVTKCNTPGGVKILDAPYSGAGTVCQVDIGTVFAEFDEFGDFISVKFAGFPGFISKEFVEFE